MIKSEFDYSSVIKPTTKSCNVIWCNKGERHGKIGFCAKHFSDGLKQQKDGIVDCQLCDIIKNNVHPLVNIDFVSVIVPERKRKRCDNIDCNKHRATGCGAYSSGHKT